MSSPVRVVFFQRKPYDFHKSLEFIFDDVRQRLKGQIIPEKKVVSYYSKGLLSRIKIIFEAKQNQGDINHVTGDIHFSAILLKKQKTILTVLDCGMLSSSKGIKHALLKYFWFTLPLKKVSFVTVISEATKDELLKYVRFKKELIKVIPVAVSEVFTYHPKPFNKEKPVILQVGTKFNKNLLRLIEALKGVSCHLNIVGEVTSDIKEKLEICGVSYSSMENLTDVEIVEQYVKCDMLSFVSTYEGFGMPIIEANATGRPVITSNILSMPEVAGNAACLVDPYNVDDIRAGIQKIIHNESYREQLIRNGLKNCQRYNAGHIANMYLELYQQVAENSKAGSRYK
jgi:glycosyltransferase involved in cell wall biosynthesis